MCSEQSALFTSIDRNNQRELLKLTCQNFRRSLKAVVVNADALSVGRVVFMLHA